MIKFHSHQLLKPMLHGDSSDSSILRNLFLVDSCVISCNHEPSHVFLKNHEAV